MASALQTFQERIRQRKLGVFVGIALALLTATIAETKSDAGRSRRSYDWYYAWKTKFTPPEAVIVFMDDFSREPLGQDALKPWSRRLHARLVDRLTEAGAGVIVFDLLFSTSTNDVAAMAEKTPQERQDYIEETAELWHAMKRNRRVVIAGASMVQPDEWVNDLKLEGKGQVEEPVPELKEAAAAWGLANLDRAGPYSRELPSGTEQIPSLTWAAAKLAGAPVAQVEKDRLDNRWFNFYGPPGTIKHVGYSDALLSTNLGKDFFANKAVFIGARPTADHAEAKLDQFETPYTARANELSTGVEVHATGYLNLVRKEWLTRWSFAFELSFLALLGCAMAVSFIFLRPLAGAGVALAISAMAVAVGTALPLKTGTWFNWQAIPYLQVSTLYVWSLVYGSTRLFIEKRLIEQTLTLHLAPDRVKQILKQPALLKPGAEKAEISIMFTDIANFSKITGRMDPGDLFAMMNTYFQTALGAVHKHEGTIIKLIGDAIFAIWNAPFPQADHSLRAARAAIQLQNDVAKIEQEQKLLPLRTRIGLHMGDAHVGNVGSTDRFDYTAMGENINLASRLEGLNKHLGTTLLATRTFQKNIEKDFATRPVGHFRFQGFDRIVEVHEILGETAASPEWLPIFRDALYAFQRSEWDKAAEGFKRSNDLRAGDGPSQFYLAAIGRLRASGCPPNWSGEIDLAEK